MDVSEYEDNTQQDRPRKVYFAGFAVFIAISVSLSVWAFIVLALAA